MKILWQLTLLTAADEKIVKLDMECRNAIFPDIWSDTINTCCLVTQKMSCGFSHFIESSEYVKLQLKLKMRNAMEGSVMNIAVCTDKA